MAGIFILDKQTYVRYNDGWNRTYVRILATINRQHTDSEIQIDVKIEVEIE